MSWGAAVGANIAGVFAYEGGERANAASAKQAHLQREQQLFMSNTAHQREVSDLRAAGLNPILSGTGGMGASTTAGAAAPVLDTIGPAVASAVSAYRTGLEGENLKETNTLIEQQQKKTAAETELAAATAQKVRAEIPKAETEAQVWIRGLQLLKHIDRNIVEPLIQRLKNPATGKAFSDAVDQAKAIINKSHGPGSSKPNPPKDYKQKFTIN